MCIKEENVKKILIGSLVGVTLIVIAVVVPSFGLAAGMGGTIALGAKAIAFLEVGDKNGAKVSATVFAIFAIMAIIGTIQQQARQLSHLSGNCLVF